MSLKAYNPVWAQREATRAAAARWQKRGLLSAPQLAAILAAHPLDYYRPPLFIRIILFLFTSLGALTLSGLFMLLVVLGQHESAADSEMVSVIIVGSLSAGAGFFVLEASINGSRLYRSGIDNALLYVSLGWLGFLVFHLTSAALPPDYPGLLWETPGLYLTTALLLVLALLVAAAVRYADQLVAAAAYATGLLALASLLLQLSAGRLLLPFALMLAAAATYFVLEKLARRPDYLYYKACLTLLKVLTLATFYLGGNYLVVREGNAALSGLTESVQIRLAGLFVFFTAVLPVLYLVVGLRRPDRLWLLAGLLIVVFSGGTLLTYYPALPAELAATLAGAVLIGAMLFVTRYLRTPRHGLTAAAEQAEDDQKLNLESLIVAQTATVPQPTAAGFEFGGGSSGGGGADGGY
ncbi:MAG: hypothetical protein H7Z21_00110 [Hymenobacter sp.]|nr:hypothetical protein [Hymenobacter sp.]